MRPPPPETDDEDEVFKTAPNASQPIMVSENIFRFIRYLSNCRLLGGRPQFA